MLRSFAQYAAALAVVTSIAACDQSPLPAESDAGTTPDLVALIDLARSAPDLVQLPDLTPAEKVCPDKVDLIDPQTGNTIPNQVVTSLPMFSQVPIGLFNYSDTPLYEGFMDSACGNPRLLEVGFDVWVAWSDQSLKYPETPDLAYDVRIGNMPVGRIQTIGGGSGIGSFSVGMVWYADYNLDAETEMTFGCKGCIDAFKAVHAKVTACIGRTEHTVWKDRVSGKEYHAPTPELCSVWQY